MTPYLVRRVGIAGGANELDAALMRLRACEERGRPSDPRWRLSYVLQEPDGRLGLACVFEARSVAALHGHAERLRLPAREIVPIARRVAVRPFAPTRVFLVRRRSAWPDLPALQRAVTAAGDLANAHMACQVCWLNSEAVFEADGRIGSACLFQAVDARSLAEHAARAGLPADEITPVLGRIVFRDPAAPEPAAGAPSSDAAPTRYPALPQPTLHFKR